MGGWWVNDNLDLEKTRRRENEAPFSFRRGVCDLFNLLTPPWSPLQ